MEFLQNPDVIYLLLAGGLMFAMLALAAPGTGFLEIGAIFVLAVAGWGAISYGLPVNWWAFALLGIGVVLFLLAVFRTRAWPLLVASIVAVVLGSAYLFRSDVWYVPAVNPLLTTVVSLLSSGFFWIIGRKSIQAALTRPTHDLDSLIGKIGEAKTLIDQEGSVLVASELWSAQSDKPIRAGNRVRVVRREGFTLFVEQLDLDNKENIS